MQPLSFNFQLSQQSESQIDNKCTKSKYFLKEKTEYMTMPCQKCGSVLIRFGAFTVCPYCNCITLLKKKKAIFDLFKNEQEIESNINTIIRNNLDKNKLTIKLCWEREKFSRAFFQKYQGLDTNEFLSSNLLILRITKDNFFSGKRNVEEIEAKTIVDAFKRIIESKETRFLLMQGFAEPLQLFDKIHALYNEHYFPILSTYEDNDIWEQPKAKEKIKEYLPLLLTVTEKQQGSTKYSPKEFIKEFYPTIHQFYCCFVRNELYNEVFGLLNNYSKAHLNPQKLMNLVNSYPMNERQLYHTSLSEFITRAQKYLDIEPKKVRELLIFSEKNTQAFPIFLAVNGRVYISHRATFLIYILLHAIVYKSLFDEETVKRSKEFEKQEVKSIFQSIGWTYLPNKTDRKKASIEIDGIATFGRKMVIIECKGWKLKPFFEYKMQQDHIIRDIKGIVDGEKYTHRKPKKIPSLLQKIDFVKANMSTWGLNNKDFDIIEGLIVLRSFPPISEYKGIHVLSIKDVAKEFGSGTSTKANDNP
jgi:uncharacterized Zn finger protein (UPF0148 family)